MRGQIIHDDRVQLEPNNWFRCSQPEKRADRNTIFLPSCPACMFALKHERGPDHRMQLNTETQLRFALPPIVTVGQLLARFENDPRDIR